MKCCGEEVISAFCPHCGKEWQREPIIEILRHIKWHLKLTENVQKRALQWDKEHPDRANDGDLKRRRSAQDRKICRYKIWIKTIEAMRAGKDAP